MSIITEDHKDTSIENTIIKAVIEELEKALFVVTKTIRDNNNNEVKIIYGNGECTYPCGIEKYKEHIKNKKKELLK